MNFISKDFDVRKIKGIWQTSVLCLIALSGISCSGNSNSDLGLVSGTVTLDGAVYPQAQVVFTPNEGRPSMGITDSNGKYQLIYIRDTKGANIGAHQVSISTVPEVTSDADDGPPFVETIPAKYNSKTTLSVQVEAGDNTHDFPLISK
ncbi:MAG: carboxypeptidase-like regulatory domain-containing protein [Pirellulales bacterium]|jgi:hypothetical protein